MGMTGLYGTVPFVASSLMTQTYSDLSRKYPARWHQHDVHLQMPIMEYTGPGLVEVEFTMALSTRWGVNPHITLALLHQYHNNALAAVLFMSGRLMGPGQSRFVITDLDEKHKYFNGWGVLIAAEVSVKMKQYEVFQQVYSQSAQQQAQQQAQPQTISLGQLPA
jgi:phage protein U